jgi:hypothetical protein
LSVLLWFLYIEPNFDQITGFFYAVQCMFQDAFTIKNEATNDVAQVSHNQFRLFHKILSLPRKIFTAQNLLTSQKI